MMAEIKYCKIKYCHCCKWQEANNICEVCKKPMCDDCKNNSRAGIVCDCCKVYKFNEGNYDN